jgi:hypothetical protein
MKGLGDLSNMSLFGLVGLVIKRASSGVLLEIGGKGIRTVDSLPVALIITAVLLLSSSACMMISLPSISAYTDKDHNTVEINAKEPFTGSDGKINIMGVVHNTGDTPLEVKLGLNITNKYNDLIPTTVTEETTTYSRVLYPYSVSPFKFSIKSINLENQSVSVGKPFALEVKRVSTPNYDEFLSLDYNNIPAGENAALIGTAKNISPFDLHNVSVYASAHDKNMIQVDSVQSNVIPVIEPGQEMAFTAIPDPSIKSQIKYFSCAGVDINSPMSKLVVGNNKFLKYGLEGPIAISDFKYNNVTDSISFGVKHYNPDGGPMAIKLAYSDKSPNLTPLSIILDGKKLPNESSLAKPVGKVLTLDIIIPPKDHELQIEGISSLIS